MMELTASELEARMLANMGPARDLEETSWILRDGRLVGGNTGETHEVQAHAVYGRIFDWAAATFMNDTGAVRVYNLQETHHFPIRNPDNSWEVDLDVSSQWGMSSRQRQRINQWLWHHRGVNIKVYIDTINQIGDIVDKSVLVNPFRV